jgi:methylated-DNA-protein-cysteine methyltransferase-like protein
MKHDGFFEEIYALVAEIPEGKVASYGQIAALLGSPGAARTVGWALHSLPRGRDIPWHRVINAEGKISYNSRGVETNLQRTLLESEGIKFDVGGKVNMQYFRWDPEEA